MKYEPWIKITPDTAVLQIDFAENYKYSAADSSQGYHRVNNQATVVTGHVWASNGCKSMVVISDCNEHTKHTV